MKQNSDLLIDGKVLVVQVSLSEAVGLNESIFIQQLHYWMKHSKNVHDGRTWVYKSVREWREENFPFWSESTIKRVIKGLRTKGIVLAGDYNKVCATTVWYTIDYDKLDAVSELVGSECTDKLGQNEPTSKVTLTEPLNQRVPQEKTSENTSDETETEKEKETEVCDSFLEMKSSDLVASFVKKSLSQYQENFQELIGPIEDPDIVASSLVNERMHLHSISTMDSKMSEEEILSKVEAWFTIRYADSDNPSYALADIQYIDLCAGLNVSPRRTADQFAGRQAFNSNLRQLIFDLKSVGASLKDYRKWLKKRRRLSVQEAVSVKNRQSFCSGFGEDLI